MKIRLIETPLAIPKYRQIRLPTVAAEFTPYADIEINDENIEPIDYSPVDIVGFTAQAYNAPRAIYLSQKFKAIGVKTIVGGPYATAMKDHALNYFDAVVVGEVEGLGPQIICDYSNNQLHGLYYHTNPNIIWGQNLPRRDLQNHNKYYWFNFPIEFSRGCPHRCTFCFGRYAYPRYRKRSLESIENELAHYDHGLIEAVDLHFAADKNYIIDICHLLKSLKVDGWFGEATLHSLNDETLLSHLEKSNLKAVFVGLESIDQNALESINKGFNSITLYKDIIRRIQDHGIFVHAGLMWGLDTDNESIYESTARFCEETGIYLASSNIVTFYPGTQAFTEAKANNKLITEDLREYDSMHVVIQPSEKCAEDIYLGIKKFTKKFYSFKSIWIRSFQASNYRMSQWVDYVAFNWIYRTYYNQWVSRLGKTETPWDANSSEQSSFPYVGGKMPLLYGILNHSWKFFHHWYALWNKQSPPSSYFYSFLMCISSVLLTLLFFDYIHNHAVTYWPVPWPSPVILFATFCGVFVISTLITSYIALLPPINNHILVFHTIKLILYILNLFPLICCVACLPPIAKGLSFLMSFFIAIHILKTLSVFISSKKVIQNFVRIWSFILFFPTLIYTESFILDHTKRHYLRHLPLYLSGMTKFILGIILTPLLFYLSISYNIISICYVGYLFRVLILYLILCGTLDVITAYWRMAGYMIKDSFGLDCFGFNGSSALWRSWNTPMNRWLQAYIYKPLGGMNRVYISVPVTFLFSGIIMASMFIHCVGYFPDDIIIFFVINGMIVTLEKTVYKNKELPKKGAYLFWIISMISFIMTAPLFFNITDRIFL